MRAAIIGGGPAGLMAAEILAAAGVHVTIYDSMPSLARQFLMAGRGGLNITHSEALDKLMTRYGGAADQLAGAIVAFPPSALIAWCAGLEQSTFTGSSGRVFPEAMKASPLLRAWLRRLDAMGVEVKLRHVFRGWDSKGQLLFDCEGGRVTATADAVILAMGGASWPRLGSDGGWVETLKARGIDIAPLRPAKCGFEVDWSQHFRTHFAGAPLKNVTFIFRGARVLGECTISGYGLEGGAIYTLSAALRDAIERDGEAGLTLDLKPDMSVDALAQRLNVPRGKTSLSNHLRKRAALPAIEIALLRETGAPFEEARKLAAHIKALPLRLVRARPIERAISTAGGVRFSGLDAHFMLTSMPGVFCAGEMLDWEAPTGGYLLQASMATGAAAGAGAVGYLNRQSSPEH